MKKIIVTTFALSAIALMSGCGDDGDGANDPGGNGGSFSIRTVTDGQHVLTGNYSTACYGSPDGRIDSLNVTNTTWNNTSMIFAGDDTCSGIETAMGRITGFIAKGAEKQISGWRGQGDVAPQRADGTGSLSENETVTSFNLKITEIDDPDGVFGGNVSVGFETTTFYVFDDTAHPDYIMYSDDDGVFASASDPYISLTPLVFPIAEISGSLFELDRTSWATGCYINGSIDSMITLDVYGSSVTGGVSTVLEQRNYLTNDGSCGTLTNSFTLAGDYNLDGVTAVIAGWVDDFGGSASAPQKLDGSGVITDTESYTQFTLTVTSTNMPGLSAGDVFPGSGYIVDNSTSVAVLYNVSSGNGNITAPLFLQ